jgi:hypothetical protein
VTGDLLGRGRMLAPAVTDEQLAQWETLCSIATEEGICPNRAIDPEDPVRICTVHQGVVLAQALRRLNRQLEAAIAEDEKAAREAEEASNDANERQDPGTIVG